MRPFTFVDLFAGIGGFHAAMVAAGGRHRFASELDPDAAAVYKRNWGHAPHGDIVPLTDPVVHVPATDVLCAGFPCQPFSKSGFQRGMEETRGTLFFNICKILAQESPPPVVLLENVRNLAGPRQQETWETIVETLRDLGYRVSSRPTVMSPHLLPPTLGGRPQVRERVFIPAVHVGRAFSRSRKNLAAEPVAVNRAVYGWNPLDWDLDKHLLQHDSEIEDLFRYRLTDAENLAIDKWNEWLRVCERGADRLPGFPIWADEFRYPAAYDRATTPAWKAALLNKNAALYDRNRKAIDAWRGGGSPEEAPLLAGLKASRRKLEWQAGTEIPRDLRQTIIHFRPSGLRAKLPSYLPALVAITQTSVVGSRGRRVTPREAARAQGLPDWFEFNYLPAVAGEAELRQANPKSYKQLGNGVNVGAAYYVFRSHVLNDDVSKVLSASAEHVLRAVENAPEDPDDRLGARPIRQHETRVLPDLEKIFA